MCADQEKQEVSVKNKYNTTESGVHVRHFVLEGFFNQ